MFVSIPRIFKEFIDLIQKMFIMKNSNQRTLQFLELNNYAF